MKKVILGSLALCAALIVGNGVAEACNKGHGNHAGKSMKVVAAGKDGVTLQFTSEGDAEAVQALQKKFADKVEKYNKGESPCGQCKAKACPFKVAGLTLAAANVDKGVEVKATGDAKKLKVFARAARLHHKAHKAKHHHGKAHVCKKEGCGASEGGCKCGKKAADPKADDAKPAEKASEPKAEEKKAE